MKPTKETIKVTAPCGALIEKEPSTAEVVPALDPFELQGAVMKKDSARALQIIQYFEANPKAAPIQLVLPTLYNLFSKTFMIFGLPSRDEKTVAAGIGVSPFFVKDYIATAKNYGYEGVEAALLLLHQYNLRSLGVHDAGTSDASLLKELIYKLSLLP